MKYFKTNIPYFTDRLKGWWTVFKQWKSYFKILMQYKVTVNFVNGDGQNFNQIFKTFVVINQNHEAYGT